MDTLSRHSSAAMLLLLLLLAALAPQQAAAGGVPTCNDQAACLKLDVSACDLDTATGTAYRSVCLHWAAATHDGRTCAKDPSETISHVCSGNEAPAGNSIATVANNAARGQCLAARTQTPGGSKAAPSGKDNGWASGFDNRVCQCVSVGAVPTHATFNVKDASSPCGSFSGTLPGYGATVTCGAAVDGGCTGGANQDECGWRVPLDACPAPSSPIPSPVPSPETSPVPSPVPSPQPSPVRSPGPSPIPSTEPSPVPSSDPSPTPSPTPSPNPSPIPSPTPPPTPSPRSLPSSPTPSPTPSPRSPPGPVAPTRTPRACIQATIALTPAPPQSCPQALLHLRSTLLPSLSHSSWGPQITQITLTLTGPHPPSACSATLTVALKATTPTTAARIRKAVTTCLGSKGITILADKSHSYSKQHANKCFPLPPTPPTPSPRRSPTPSPRASPPPTPPVVAPKSSPRKPCSPTKATPPPRQPPATRPIKPAATVSPKVPCKSPPKAHPPTKPTTPRKPPSPKPESRVSPKPACKSPRQPAMSRRDLA